MQVLCTPSEISPDIYCPVCFKGFRLHWERTSASDREAHLPDVYDELREHHTDFPLVAPRLLGVLFWADAMLAESKVSPIDGNRLKRRIKVSPYEAIFG